jgi:putative hemolysin
MTPRSKIVWIDVKSDKTKILDTVELNRFSRLIVCHGTLDHPVGFIHTKNLLPEALRCIDVNLDTLLSQLLCVPERTSLLKLLNLFKKEKVHIAIIVDEHGTTEGLVTLTDVMEAIAGDLPELGEDEEPMIVQRYNGSWLVNGTLPVDELEAITGIDFGKGMKTVAGFVLDHLGRIPGPGDSFVHRTARFEVVDMDGNRIDKVLIEINLNNSLAIEKA